MMVGNLEVIVRGTFIFLFSPPSFACRKVDEKFSASV